MNYCLDFWMNVSGFLTNERKSRRLIFCLKTYSECAILIIEKGRPQKRPTLNINNLNLYVRPAVTIAGSGGYFFTSKIV